MNWIQIALISLVTLSSIGTVLNIDEERKPTTKGGAVVIVLLNVLIILAIINI